MTLTPNDYASEIAFKHKDTMRWQKPRRISLLSLFLSAGSFLIVLTVLVVRLLSN